MAFPPSSSHDWSRCNNIISISGHSILLIINRELISRIWPYAFCPLPPVPQFATLLRHRVTLGSSRMSGCAECFENTYSRNPPPPRPSRSPSVNISRRCTTHIRHDIASCDIISLVFRNTRSKRKAGNGGKRKHYDMKINHRPSNFSSAREIINS